MAGELVTVAHFDIPAKAHIARNALEEAGIRAVVQDEQLVAMDYLLSLAVGGIKVQVLDEDADRAAAVLRRLAASAGATDESGEGTPDEAAMPADNVRDRYAVRALWVAMCSLLIAPLALYTGYLLIMTVFSEGKLTRAPLWAVVLASLVSPILMFVSPVWVGAVYVLVTTGHLPD